eukprot:687462_1
MTLCCNLIAVVLSVTFQSIDGIGLFHRGSPTLPRADYGMAIGSWNNTISIFGGEDYHTSYVEYDIASGSIIDHGQSFISPGRIYGSSSFFTQMDQYLYSIDYNGQRFIRFDLSTKTYEYNWKSLYPFPKTVYQTGCLASTDQYLFVVGGGTTSGSPYKNFQIVNLTEPISSSSWITGSLLNEGRGRSTCTVHPSTNRLYVFGGKDTDTIESINVASGAVISTETWSYNANTLLIQTRAPSSITWGEDIYIIGGYDYDYSTGDNFLNMIQIFSTLTGTVTESGTTLDFATMSAAAVRVGKIIYVFGGAPYASPVVQHSSAWQHCDLLATRPPTTAPTLNPTQQPTTPTSVPTKHPTVQTTSPTTLTSIPTRYPSSDPTKSPTIHPTEVTVNPTEATVNPSMTPSNQPSKAPSNNPSENPTQVPTGTPTDNPTYIPTTAPTKTPSIVPSISPTFVPTISPLITSIPTRSPTSLPSVSPTEAPITLSPSSFPTASPTVFPIQAGDTSFPTLSPTMPPVRSPTISPTSFPTMQPVQLPSKSPTSFPTKAGDTRFPTLLPTIAPVQSPTVSPTSFPTKTGDTRFPTLTPSMSPAESPTMVPTSFPIKTEDTLPPSTAPTAPIIHETVDPTDDVNEKSDAHYVKWSCGAVSVFLFVFCSLCCDII